MLSASELERELRTILDKVRRIRPPLARKPDAFHEDKGDVAESVLKLIDEVKGK